jgi:hypothetical protein
MGSWQPISALHEGGHHGFMPPIQAVTAVKRQACWWCPQTTPHQDGHHVRDVFGDGAAALLFGTENVIAEFKGPSPSAATS